MPDIRGERSIIVDAPIQDVFEYVSDFQRHTEWSHQIVEINKDTDGPTGVGTRFRSREKAPSNVPLPMKLLFPLMLRMVGMEKYTRAEITEWEPDRKVAWKAEAPLKTGGRWMRAEWEVELEARDGATGLTQRYRYLPEHERAKKILSDEQKSSERIGEEVSSNLEQLKQILETNTVDSAKAGATSKA